MSYVHPRANHQVQWGAVTVAYCLERAQRRSIGLMVSSEGLVVRMPLRASLRDVEAALLEKSRWILKKLQETQQREQRQQAARMEWRDGALLPYLGQQLLLNLQPVATLRRASAVMLSRADNDETPKLQIAVPLTAHGQPAHEVHIKAPVQLWFMRQAQQHFKQRLDYYAPELRVRWTRLALSNAVTRWGSAKADGSIRLNWRLMHFEPAVVDYVVVHELSHLREMNHSPRFWSTVESVIPDYARLRKQLKESNAPAW